jgi:hypothetical protein
MSQVNVECFLGRLITDAGFRSQAEESLNAACFNAGIVLTTQELYFLNGMDFSQFGVVAETIDDSIRRK